MGDLKTNQKNLAKAADIPYFIFTEVDKRIGECQDNSVNYFFTVHSIKIIKKYFANYPEYLRRINKELFQKLFDIFLYFFSYRKYLWLDTLELMINMYGPQNIEKYVNHLSNLTEEFPQNEDIARQTILKYKDYIKLSHELKDEIKTDWKLKTRKEIWMMHDEIVEIYNSKIRELSDKKDSELWEKLNKTYQKYLYKGETFSIISPKNKTEIINEGFALHHCVSGYVKDVEEKKTKILFIRKNEDIDTPFFTLEIKNGKIRQCHGYGNRNIDTEDGMEKFLMEYCHEKNIFFSKGEEAI